MPEHSERSQVQREVAIEWDSGGESGEISVGGGRLLDMQVAGGQGRIEGNRFAFESQGSFRLKMRVEGIAARYTTAPTIVSVKTHNPFSFLLRDVNSRFPIWIPEYRVVVTDADDIRSVAEIEQVIAERGGQSRLKQFEAEPEESFAMAAAQVRRMSCHTWLGVSRNMRIFAIGEKLDWIEPRFHYFQALLPENDHRPFRYEFVMGRGWGVSDQIERHLEEQVLPILHGRVSDGDIDYTLAAFTTLEEPPFTAETLRGTDYLVADGYAKQHMFTPAQQKRFDSLHSPEIEHGEETVLCLRLSATNNSSVPRYAFLKSIWPSKGLGEISAMLWQFEDQTGFATYESGRVFAISRLNGSPLEQHEVVILLQPGESAVMDVFLPHRPISRARAEKLSHASFDKLFQQCKAFWQSKLEKSAQVETPETRITEMIHAGLLHLDLITYGREPDETLAATIGDYPPIGSESSPIIQFFDSMGWHDVARRSLGYFLEKQHDSGFMQNFNNYMLEPGAVLWSIGEHYRYTRDERWLKEIAPKVIKTCEFLRDWRRRNQRVDIRGKRYGLLEGKTADPEDPFCSFMLNGYAYLGLSRVAEMFTKSDPTQAATWRTEADALKGEIRDAFFTSLAASPVVPLGDGRWRPTCPPWVESRGPLALHIDGSAWHTHGSMVARDSLLGPLYLVFQEVLDPVEPCVDFLLDFHAELMTERNVVFSQPYYSRHPWIHLMRGETRRFLKAYYNTMASLADRDTYSFWEHYFRASAHKTHEEAWFLMETRWMLYLERDSTLHLLTGIPRQYLADGKRIVLDKVASYFGPLTLNVSSAVKTGRIFAEIRCRSERKPRQVELRVPHPEGKRAKLAEGGSYDAAAEKVIIEPFNGSAAVTLHF